MSGGTVVFLVSFLSMFTMDFGSFVLPYFSWAYLLFCSAIQLVCGQRWFFKEISRQGLLFTLPVRQKKYVKTYQLFINLVFLCNFILSIIISLIWISYDEGAKFQIFEFFVLLLCGFAYSQYLLSLYLSGRIKSLWGVLAGLGAVSMVMGIAQLYIYEAFYPDPPYGFIPLVVLALGLLLNFRGMKHLKTAKRS